MNCLNNTVYNKSQLSDFFNRWTRIPKKASQEEMKRFQETFIQSQYFGELIYDNQWLDLAQYFSRDFFVKNYPAIVYALKIAGTEESFLTIIKSALGNTDVWFENPTPAHMIIHITMPTEEFGFDAKTTDGRADVVAANPNPIHQRLVLRNSVAQLTVNETIKMLELLNVGGIYLEIDFTE